MIEEIQVMYRTEATEKSWAAGFFDGEGSWVNTKHRSGFVGIQMTIHNTDISLLERFQKAVGGVGYIKYEGKASPRHKPIWRYRINRFEDVRTAILHLLPYLGTAKINQYQKCIDRRISTRLEHFGVHK